MPAQSNPQINPPSPLSTNEILSIDRRHLWHPYAGVDSDQPLYPVASAEGAVLTLSDGRTLIDGMSSWWSTIHGYNHPVLNAALSQQAAQVAHVMFGGLTHEPAARLAQTLAALCPPGLDKVFLCDSGSVAVEVAMKMALQYARANSRSPRTRFLTIKQGYHGDTFGAMSVCDPVTGMHQLFSGVLQQQVFVEAPRCAFDQAWEERYFDDFERGFLAHREQLAAVILEPIVQGAGGMRFYSPVFLQRVRQLCSAHRVLLIADEIATGFGRSGKLFACEHAAISPDIMCLGKALTGGYLTLAATLCSDEVARGICAGQAGVFMHGPTFMGNPLACAVANASIDLLEKNDWQTQVAGIEAGLRAGLAPCAELPNVREVRVLGAIGVVEMNNAVSLAEIQPLLVARGIWLRPFGKLVYMMPPYICSAEQIATLTRQTHAVLATLAGR